jgi:hypothetical protein
MLPAFRLSPGATPAHPSRTPHRIPALGRVLHHPEALARGRPGDVGHVGHATIMAPGRALPDGRAARFGLDQPNRERTGTHAVPPPLPIPERVFLVGPTVRLPGPTGGRHNGSCPQGPRRYRPVGNCRFALSGREQNAESALHRNCQVKHRSTPRSSRSVLSLPTIGRWPSNHFILVLPWLQSPSAPGRTSERRSAMHECR